MSEKIIARPVYIPESLCKSVQKIADALGNRQFNRVVNDALRDHVKRNKGSDDAIQG